MSEFRLTKPAEPFLDEVVVWVLCARIIRPVARLDCPSTSIAIKSMRIYILLTLLLVRGVLAASAESSGETTETNGTINLRAAVSLALARHPGLAAYSKDIRIADSEKLQAGVWQNPVVGFAMEDVAGSGSYSSFDRAQNTLQLSQLFELGGKRRARIRAAEAQQELVEWDYETRRLEIAADTAASFVDLLGAQRRLAQAGDTLALTEKFAPAAQKRADAGQGSPVEVTRVNVAIASAKMAVEQQRGQVAVARKRLAALWGSTEPLFTEAVGDLEHVRDLPTLADATVQLGKNPLLARYDAEVARRGAELLREKAKRHPDLTVSAGVRQFSEDNEAAAVIGISLPLPLFDRNQGGIAAAQAQTEKVHDLQEAAKVQLNTSIAIAYEQMENAKLLITTYHELVLPQVEDAYTLTNEGYENGRFGYLDVLDARRTLTDAQQQHLDALVRYHKAVAEIEGLTGQALPSTVKSKE